MKSRALSTALLLFGLPAGAIAGSVTYDSTKGLCVYEPDGDLTIICPRATRPIPDLDEVQIQNVTFNGVESVKFTVPMANRRLTVTRAEGRLSIESREPPVAVASARSDVAGILAQAASPRIEVPATTGKPVPAANKPAAKDTPARADALKRLRDLQLDYSIPDMPAFTVLGMTPENVSHPRTARALAAAVKEGIDENGKLKTGLALEFKPLRLDDPEALLRRNLPGGRSAGATADSMLRYAIYNTSISIATSKGSSAEDPSTKLGVGIKIPIFDFSDARTDAGLLRCYADVKQAWIAAGEDEDAETKARNLGKRCYAQRESARWNASAWTVSIGNAWTSDTGNFSDRKTGTKGAWTTFAYGFEEWLQFLVHARALDKERVTHPTQTGQFVNRDSRVGALGVKIGSENFNGSFQWSYQRLKLEGFAETDKVRRLALGVEYRVADDMWLVASVGGEGGRINGENKTFVLAGFRFDLGGSSGLNPKRPAQ